MNKRTGWNRRGLQLRNPIIETLEARLVLAEAAQLGVQPLLAPAELHGKPAPASVTIDSVVGTGNPKAASSFLDHKDLGVNAGPLINSPHYLSQGSLTEPQTAIAPHPISFSIEESVVGLAPSSATEVASAIRAFASLASAFSEGALAKSTHASVTSNQKHGTPAPSEASAADNTEANGANRTADAASSETGHSAEPTPPTDRAAPEAANATVGLTLAASANEPSRGGPLPPPPQSGEAQFNQAISLVTGQDVTSFVSLSRFIDGYALQEKIHDSQDLPTADFTAIPVDEATQGRALSLADQLALKPNEIWENVPSPLSADLIVDFLPCTVGALQTTIENLLAESEQVLQSGAGRQGLALGLLIAVLATAGMAGHAACERLRRPREQPGALDWPNGGTLTWHNLAVGLQLSEVP
jgi:hypothetical protein